MNKLIIATTLLATAAAALPANAAPRTNTTTNPSAQSTIQVGNQCFKPTDSSRGFGYWDSCENVYAFSLGRRGQRGTIDQDRGSDGGGGDGGGGGGGGGNR
jgi:hypothetical protein